jgi:O-antigen/teichoic acid export membrane protein
MGKSYIKNYLKIYFWQGISLVLNFFTMFAVIPFLSSDPITYGIYSVCVSFSIFLAYADLGFMSAGQKYAAEYYAKGNREKEIKIIGFTGFILLIFLLLFFLGFIYLSKNPVLLVKGIETNYQFDLSSSLFLILAIFTPTTLLQRIVQMIFAVRMKDYIIQRNNIIGNIIKLISVLYFFKEGSYNIVGYFLFTQIINLFAALFALFIAHKNFNYNLTLLIKSICFNKLIFKKTKSLALASLFITFCWILYYELDSVVIGKLLGAKSVAIYSIGLTALSFFRSLLGIAFSPFSVRFNHFIGTEDDISLKSFYLSIVIIFAPFVFFPIISIAIFAKPIILTWVGVVYISSVASFQLLVFCNIFAFITYPTNFMLLAKEKQNVLYKVNLFLPLIFWSGIYLTINKLGILSFALFKVVAFLFTAIFLYRVMIRYLKLNFLCSIKEIFKPMAWSSIFLIATSFFIRNYLPNEKSKINLIIVTCAISFIIVISFIIQFITSNTWKKKVIQILNQI